MLKAVIFDLDGLLIDSENISYEMMNSILAPFHKSLTLNEYATIYSGKAMKENMRNFKLHFDLPYTTNQLISMILEMEPNMLEKGVPLKKGAKELLAYLKHNHIPIALASSSLKKRAHYILEQNHIKQYFDVFVCAEDCLTHKPEPDVFLIAAKKLDVQPQSCLVLEDSEAGILAAFRANIPVICIPDLNTPSKEYLTLTQCVLSDLTQVIDYMKTETDQN